MRRDEHRSSGSNAEPRPAADRIPAELTKLSPPLSVSLEAAEPVIGAPCLTVRQTAAHFGVMPPTVYAWIEDEFLGHLRLPGGSIRIRPTDILEFKEKQ